MEETEEMVTISSFKSHKSENNYSLPPVNEREEKLGWELIQRAVVNGQLEIKSKLLLIKTTDKIKEW